MGKGNQGYCSWCFNEVVHTLIEHHKLTRDLYKCPECEMRLVRCRACANYARWDSCEVQGKRIKHHYQFCAQHRGDFFSFDSLNTKLNDPSEYLNVYKKRHLNWKKITNVSVAVAVTGGIALPLSLFAAGGAGLAAALSTGIGGTFGGVVANAYFGNVRGFRIFKVREGQYPAIVTVNGFLTEQHQDTADWEDLLPDEFSKNAWFHVDWEAKTLASIGALIVTLGGVALHAVLEKAALKKAAKEATKQAGKKVGPIGGALLIAQFARNPWYVAMMKSHMTGVILADVLSRCEGKKFVLFGHSLGARVIFEILRTLGADSHVVEHAHLFGGAVGNAREEWREIKSKVEGPIFNYHSDNDMVLKHMYKVGTFFQSDPIGRHPIEGVEGIINIDVSKVVPGHMQYKTDAVKPYVGRQETNG